MLIGPQVAFVDDVESQITEIKNALAVRHAGTIFFDARPDKMKPPDEPINSIEILFLDLYYNSSTDFDVDKAAQWVQDIIPENKKYTLVIWSRDTQNHTKELLEVLAECNLTPNHLEEWQKTDHGIDISGKLSVLINQISMVSEEIVLGEIIAIEEDGVLIRCRLGQVQPAFQVRKFDLDLLAGVDNYKVGCFVRIHLYTKPGARMIDIFGVNEDLTELFEEPDFFEGLEDNSFFIDG